MIPWRNGKLLVWDATSPDTFAPSYVSRATSEAGAVAAQAEDRKRTKYTCLEPTYTFTPIAIETSGVFGPLTLQFLKDLGNRLRQATGDETPIPTLFRDCLCQCREETQHRCWEQLDTDTFFL